MEKQDLLHKKVSIQLQVSDEDVLRHHDPQYTSGLPVVTGTIVRRVHTTPQGWPHWMYLVELDKPLVLDYDKVSPKSRGQTAQYFLLETGLTAMPLPDSQYEEYLLKQGRIIGSLWRIQELNEAPNEMNKADFDRFPYISACKATLLPLTESSRE